MQESRLLGKTSLFSYNLKFDPFSFNSSSHFVLFLETFGGSMNEISLGIVSYVQWGYGVEIYLREVLSLPLKLQEDEVDSKLRVHVRVYTITLCFIQQRQNLPLAK